MPQELCRQPKPELLAVVFACDHFDACIYGCSKVHIQTDHKPLESIVQKPLHSAPKRLQRMLLQFQKYNLQWTYKKGTTITLQIHSAGHTYQMFVHVIMSYQQT